MNNKFKNKKLALINSLKLKIKLILMSLPNFVLSRKIVLKKEGFNNWEDFYFTGEKYYLNKHVANIESKYDYIIDIGANIGEWTQLLLPKISKETKIILVEPQTKCLEQLKILQKGYQNIYILNRAISEKNSFLNIYFEMPGSQLASTIKSNNIFSRYIKGKKKIIFSKKVKSITPKNLFKKFKIKKYHKIFLKIDVEGIEEKVLKKILSSNLNFQEIMFEFNPQNSQSLFDLFYNLKKKKKIKFQLFKLLPFNKGIEEISIKKKFFPKLYCNLILRNLTHFSK